MTQYLKYCIRFFHFPTGKIKISGNFFGLKIFLIIFLKVINIISVKLGADTIGELSVLVLSKN
jgi:hypothetical protein